MTIIVKDIREHVSHESPSPISIHLRMPPLRVTSDDRCAVVCFAYNLHLFLIVSYLTLFYPYSITLVIP